MAVVSPSAAVSVRSLSVCEGRGDQVPGGRQEEKTNHLVKAGMPGSESPVLSLCPVKSHYLPTRTQVQTEAKRKARARAHQQRHSEGDQRHTAGLNRRACVSQGAMSAAVAFSRPFNRNPKRDLKTFNANKIAVYVLKKKF